jgi:hypothetical protein
VGIRTAISDRYVDPQKTRGIGDTQAKHAKCGFETLCGDFVQYAWGAWVEQRAKYGEEKDEKKT